MSDLNISNFEIVSQDALDQGINSEYGTIPISRSISELMNYGMIILDKHAGPTSHEVVAIVKKIMDIDKAGHSGTLDPNVTGVLPIGLNESTKILHSLLLAEKRYIGILRSNIDYSKEAWENISTEYSGLIYQVPPLKSNVVKKLRKRKIYHLEILESDQKEVLFEVGCQAGTYIRTLCVDMGRSIGSSSYMKELRRIQSGPFNEQQTITLTQLFDAYEDYKDGLGEENLRKIILPIEDGIQHLPKVILRDNAVDPVCHGSIINIPAIIAFQEFSKDQLIALMTSKGALIGLGEGLQSSKIISMNETGSIIKPNRIIMPRGTYPKYTKD